MEIKEVPAGKDLEIVIKLHKFRESQEKVYIYFVERRKKNFRVFHLYNYF